MEKEKSEGKGKKRIEMMFLCRRLRTNDDVGDERCRKRRDEGRRRKIKRKAIHDAVEKKQKDGREEGGIEGN